MAYLSSEAEDFVIVGDDALEISPTESSDNISTTTTLINDEKDVSLGCEPRKKSQKVCNKSATNLQTTTNKVEAPWAEPAPHILKTSASSDGHLSGKLHIRSDVPETKDRYRWIYKAGAHYDATNPEFKYQVESKGKRNRARIHSCSRPDAPKFGPFEHAWLPPHSEECEVPDMSRLDTKQKLPCPYSVSFELGAFFRQPDINVTARQFADPEHNTALHTAAVDGYEEAVRYLLSWAPVLGLDFVNAQNSLHQTPLSKVLLQPGRSGIVRLLLEHGAGISSFIESSDVLFLLRECRDPATLAILMSNYVDINTPGPYENETVLHHFCRRYPPCEIEIERLLGLGADVNIRNGKNQVPYECLYSIDKRRRLGQILWDMMSEESRTGLKGPSQISVVNVFLEQLPRPTQFHLQRR